MTDAELAHLFTTARTIAIIGAKDTEGQPVARVGQYLIDAGYTVIPVHPVRKSVWGLPCYATLGDIPVPVDIVNLFRASELCFAHARECLALPSPPLAFWMQLCIRNAECHSILAPHNCTVIEDSCIMVEHARVFAVSLPPHEAPACHIKRPLQ